MADFAKMVIRHNSLCSGCHIQYVYTTTDRLHRFDAFLQRLPYRKLKAFCAQQEFRRVRPSGVAGKIDTQLLEIHLKQYPPFQAGGIEWPQNYKSKPIG